MKGIINDHLRLTHGYVVYAMADDTTAGVGQGVIFLTNAANAKALTLRTPIAGADDGKVLRVINAGDGATAPANTVVCTSKIWDGTAGVNTTITMAAVPGACATLISYGGFWYTLALNAAPAS